MPSQTVDAANFVPYINATQNLDLGTKSITASNFSGTSSGTNTGDQTITLTGAVTGSGTGTFATSLGSFTTAQLNTALSDNDIATGGGTATGTNTGDETDTTIKSKLGITTISGSNTGDQTSIVGITGTLAEFNTALTGADFATGGGTVTGTSSGTNTGDQTITLTGDVTGSGTGSFAATLANTAVTA